MPPSTRLRLELDDQAPELLEIERSDGAESVAVVVPARNGEAPARVRVRVLQTGPRPLLLVGDRVVALSTTGSARSATSSAPGLGLAWQGRTHLARALEPGAPAPRAGRRLASGLITAPMPGRVVQIHVRPGDQVPSGAPLVVIEAMKMQNALFAPGAGQVARVLVVEGETIDRGATLIELTLVPGAAASP